MRMSSGNSIYLAALVTLLFVSSCSQKETEKPRAVPVEELVESLIDITQLPENNNPQLLVYMTPGSCSTCRSYAFKTFKYLNPNHS